uniref:Signal peptidase I n=1 Tax=Syphacia muris TaxID=451379 RepID=A0A158R471_9BILA
MDYSRFLAVFFLIIASTVTIYVGCIRSYAIYFFERDSRRVIFLEAWSAAVVPVALSFILIFSYLTAKRTLATSEEITAKQLFKSSQASFRSAGSQNFSRTSELENIPESPAGIHKENNGSNDSLDRSYNDEGDSADEQNFFRDPVTSVEKHSDSEDSDSQFDKRKNTGGESNADVIFTLDSTRKESQLLISRKSSADSNNETSCVYRKQSEIYKQIGKIDLVPSSLKKLSFQVVKPSPLRRFRKDSMFDVFVQLIGIQLPIWLSVVAVYITLVEILSMKFYTVFYYHHPGLKLMAMFIALFIGLFHEWKPTYFVNNMLGVTAAYVVIARVQTVSYIAGIVFLIGMVIFDLFWLYGIDLFSTVTRDTSAPILLVMPWGDAGKKERLATLDIIVPGIFLNILIKFADMYDSGAFYPSFYAVIFGLIVTFLLHLYKDKTIPAIVLPAAFAVVTSLVTVNRAGDLLQFEVKH